MNTQEVELRLEALAAASANPDVPEALFDRLAALEAGTTDAGVGTQPALGKVRAFPRERMSRRQTLLGLGLAATLMVAGSLAYAAGSQFLRTNPTPLPHATSTTSLGPWKNVAALGATKQYQTVSLSWQAGQIVGLAQGVDAGGNPANCVLVSKDGRDWSCSPLPRPADLCALGDYCVVPGAVAVGNGRWIAVGGLMHTSAGDAPAEGSDTLLLTWTSSDGITWHEQTGARFPVGYQGMPGIQLLPTPTGFVMGGFKYANPTEATDNALWTTTDGTSWKPVTFAGSARIEQAWLSGDPTAGYVAFGNCLSTPSIVRPCAAHSSDGVTWAISDPASTATSDLSGRFVFVNYGSGSKYEGRWVFYMTAMTGDGTQTSDYGSYEASSTDGINWRVSRIPNPELYLYQATYSAPGAGNRWAMEYPDSPAHIIPNVPSPAVSEVPDWTQSTYWSEQGLYWQRVEPAATGRPVALVETPTELIAIMAIDPNGVRNTDDTPTFSVWAAAKH